MSSPATSQRVEFPPPPPLHSFEFREATPHGSHAALAAQLVDRLDARHEELIARLDELNSQIEAALAEFGRSRQAPPAEVPVAKAA